jgi:hypothetical protein
VRPVPAQCPTLNPTVWVSQKQKRKKREKRQKDDESMRAVSTLSGYGPGPKSGSLFCLACSLVPLCPVLTAGSQRLVI